MNEHIQRKARGIFAKNKENALSMCRALKLGEESWWSFMVCYDTWHDNGATYTVIFDRLDNLTNSWSIVVDKKEVIGRLEP